MKCHARIMKILKTKPFETFQINENHEIPFENLKIMNILELQGENHENHMNVRIQCGIMKII